MFIFFSGAFPIREQLIQGVIVLKQISILFSSKEGLKIFDLKKLI
jgi:hypothetical protein